MKHTDKIGTFVKPVLIILLCVAITSCQQKEAKIDVVDWDFTRIDFKEESISLLSGYSSFDFTKLTDSILILHGEIFQGWKNKPLRIYDTLKLTEKYFVQDSLVLQQIVSYSKPNTVFFQLVITKTGGVKENLEMETTQPTVFFDYKGKLFIKKGHLHFFAEDLWYK